MRNRAIKRFYKKQLLWHRRWIQGMPVTETILFMGILIAVLIKYGTHLPGRSPACGESYSCQHMNPKYEHMGDFPFERPMLKEQD